MPIQVKTLLFDIGGTVFDWNAPLIAALSRHAAFAGIDPAAFALDCRAGFLDAAGSASRGETQRQSSDLMLANVIDGLLGALRVAPDEEARRDLHHAWRHMVAWPGAREGIERLRQRIAALPLTILSWSMASGSSRASGIVWDGYLCCEMMGLYKPDPACYARAATLVDCRPHEIAMVAAHPSDLRAAQACGYRAFYVFPQIEDPGEDYADTGFAREFDIVARDFGDLARLLT
ncbi:HAD-IA family hydrolase [Frigidibacter sp. RF13]|uniref:HAD-IA family hydrolase n=1 Tax=Frigidibacter sp. RF13 TaxID=2997340 RepID=UPI002270786A|nr:HAD-IA family hydrolase [Frigidibacter sp. RF13]MCY1126616.1 HAD-IA family hydrolase [Frigidibacter sp. RF13]